MTTAFTPQSVSKKEAKKEGLVEISHVHKFYGEHEVLKDISLTVNPVEVVSLIGPSGSGKSTLLRTINHLESIDSGDITVDGEYIGYRRKGDLLYELPEREVLRRRATVGLVFQNFNLFPHLTAVENVAEGPVALKRLSKAAAKAQAIDLLASVGLADKGEAYPRQLSGGQQQRVAIARALALDPDVILSDGALVESGTPEQVLDHTRHERTRAFIESIL